jgi:hypothetical protein
MFHRKIGSSSGIALGLTFNQQQKLKNLQKIDEKILSKLATHIN